MRECDKRNSCKISKHFMIYIFSNNDEPRVNKTLIPLHYTRASYTSLRFTTLVDINLFPFKLHLTTFHCTSLPSHLT